MNLIEVRRVAKKDGALPMSRSTIYKWHHLKRFPKLILKIANKLFWDMDEWEAMARGCRKIQVERAENDNTHVEKL